MDLLPLFAAYATLLKFVLVVVAVLIFVSGVDDLFVDLYFCLRSLYRKCFVYRKHKPLSVEQLRAKPEQPLAIMIPAWQEAEVIAHMLLNALATFEYKSYVIFVGAYPNDHDTQREVESVRARTDAVQCVVTPNDGPTSKADCLNWIVQGIRDYEEQHGIRFAGLIMHDAEDVVHPLELKMFNYLFPRFHFVQLPVYPLEPRWWQLTAGHYLDEFAENHGKDLVVRESLIGQVPCAGVAAGFERDAIDVVADQTGNLIFDTNSLTEDYEFTFRLYEMGLRKQIFVRFGVEKTVERRWLPFLPPREVRVTEYVATREFFPRSARAAVKQKSRWIVGIVFQGWRNLGWHGSLGVRYMLARDRKALINAFVILLGYFLVLNLTAIWLVSVFLPQLGRLPSLVESGSLLAGLLVINGVFLANRLVQRLAFVWTIYGIGHALMSVPRQVWGNVVNFFAVVRAIRLFTGSLRSGRRIAWDKTDHAFPTVAQLRPFRQKLGDLLQGEGLITVEQLDAAIAHQQETGQRLGEAVLDLGFAGEQDVYDTLARQLSLERTAVLPDQVPAEALRRVPKAVAARHFLVPLRIGDDGTLELATDQAFDHDTLDRIAAELSEPVRLYLAPRRDVAYARHRLYASRRQAEPGRPRLGERLLRAGLIDERQLNDALDEQRRRYKPLGAILVADGAIRQEALNQALAELSEQPGRTLGEHLVDSGRISRDQLDHALAEQHREARSLGQILVARGVLTQQALAAHLSAGAEYEFAGTPRT